MPIYLYQNDKTKEIVEVIQSMNDEHIYSKNGIKYTRIWCKPQAMFDAIKIDPFNSKDFSKRIEKNKGNYGNLLDESKELSLKRQDIAGHDPVKDKYWTNWSKKRGGRKPPPTTDTVVEF